ncbi:Zinc finger CCHC-type [Arabidopsis suecica]|uniref:Zinc finger CCHC-type n=1 Tax=Arabidopsis suecica TaxID=45249 RepID=A0A8T1YQ33_ARASU|nr:Zinc finger CCHC-type [Arabidopsis suecica]
MASSPSATSESILTREMEGSDSSVETYPSEDLDEFDDDDVETSVESDKVVPLGALGGNFGNVPITDFVVRSDDSYVSSDESEEQMTTGYLFEDSHIDVPIWEGPDGVMPRAILTVLCSYRHNMGFLDKCWLITWCRPMSNFATPLSPPTPNFVEISSYSKLSDADELGNVVSFSNYVKSETPSETPRMSILPRRFTSMTWYNMYDGANSEMFHMRSKNEEVDEEMDEEVPDPIECETLPDTPPLVEEPGVLFPPDESFREPVTLGSSSMATMIENMIAAGILVVTEMEREDGRRSKPYSMTPFCFTCGQDGHYPRACPYVHQYHSYARMYVICYECGDEGHYTTVCPRKRPENPGP